MRVKYLSQEHNTLTLARARNGTARSGPLGHHASHIMHYFTLILRNIHQIFTSLFFSAGLLVHSTTITTNEGQNVTLDCTASLKEGVWMFTTWFYGKQKLITIKPNSKISINTHRQISVTGRDSIRLYGVDRFDHGGYSCRVLHLLFNNNSFKNVTENVLLLVKGELKELLMI